MILMELTGVIMLSYLSKTFFEYANQINVEQIIKLKVDELTLWLFRVDRQRADLKIADKIYDTACECMENTIRFSSIEVFTKYSFYKDLPPPLQTKVVKSCLNQFYTTCIFYFNDYN